MIECQGLFSEATDELADLYKEGGHSEKVEEMNLKLAALANRMDALQEETTAAERQLHARVVKSQVS